MRIIDLTLKDLLQIVRDWKAAVFLLIMPLVFTFIFGFAFGGFGSSEESDPRLAVGVLDLDNGRFSPHFITLLDYSEILRPEPDNEATTTDLEEAVLDEDLVAAVIIPPGFSDGLGTDDPIQLTVIVNPNGNAGITAQNELQAVVTRLLSAMQTGILSTQAYESQQAFASEADRQAYFDTAVTRAVAAWQAPPITVGELQSDTAAEENDGQENAFAQSSPGMMLQFAIAGLIGAAEILVSERKSRTLQRLLTTAISRAEILAGHFLAMFVMIFAQLAVLITVGQLLLRLDYFRVPLGTLFVTVGMALFAASMGLLIGALAKKPEQVTIFALIPMFIFAGLGGAWVPLEFTGETFQTVGHFTPIAWAMDGYQNIIIRGLDLNSVLLPGSVLLLYALAFFLLAIWRFRFE